MSAIESSQAQCKQKILQKQQHGYQHHVEQQQHFQSQETKATMKTSENLSIASSSALVGENVLDIEDTNPPCPLTPKSSSSQGSVDRRGVSHHVYSPVKVKEMLNTYGGADDLEIFHNIHPAHYHRQLRDAKASTFIPTLEKPVAPPTPPTDYSNIKTNANEEEPRSLGIMEATKKWFQSRKERQQREALERQVEEQRQILLHQSEKLKDEARRATFGDHYVDEEEIVRVRVEKGRAAEERGLNGNETFKSIMYSQKTSGGGICSALYYSDDEFYDVDNDDDYGKGGSGSDNHRAASYKSYEDGSIGSKENYTSAEQSMRSMDIGVESIVSQSTCDNGANKHHTKGSDEEKDDFLKISSPSDTFSGQGMSVKVEIIEPKPKSDKDAFIGEVKIEQERNNIPFLLKNDHMKSILTLGLPASIMFSKWKRLYSLQRDGDSFEGAFLRKVKGQNRTLLVIKTTRGDVMGGYAESPWESQGGSSGAVFYGSAQACLFCIRKDPFSSSKDGGEVRVFKWTGANRYIQLCDVQGKMLAFGGGGDSGEFGLRVEDDFRTGSTGSCETFGNEPLCEQVHFDILDVECWGFKTGF